MVTYWLYEVWDKFLEHYNIAIGYLLLFKYKGKAEFDVCILDRARVEALYPRLGLALVDDDIVPMDEGFTRYQNEDTIISNSSNDIFCCPMLGQSRKGDVGLRNMSQGQMLSNLEQKLCSFFPSFQHFESPIVFMDGRHVIREHMEILEQENASNIQLRHDLEFPQWFDEREPDALFARGTSPKTSFVELPSPITGGEQAREQDDGYLNSIYMGSDPSVDCASNDVEEIEELHGDENEASCVIRKFGKWRAPKWAKLPKADLEEMFKMTTRKFVHDEGGHVKPALIKQINSQYQNRRYNFHKLFLKYEAKEAALLNRPKHVKEEISEQNKQNRAKQKSTHTTGMKSYLRHKEERTKMKDLLSKYKDEGSNTTEDDVGVKVVGHVPRYVRSCGPQKPRLSAKNIAEIEEARKKAVQAEQRAAELEVQVKAQQKLMEKLENQQRETNNLLQALAIQLQMAKQGSRDASTSTNW
ncbi:hypothetical protein ACH5RR_001089 [Cinchona calisaya]|uniref:Uncharacterized protein n=1 Tax=Cinchona calisaya TaxID=153742 RepID=A0ABD3B375_9GENT